MRAIFQALLVFLLLTTSAFSEPKAITVITDDGPMGKTLMESFLPDKDGIEIRRVIANDCADLTEALQMIYSDEDQSNSSVLIVASRCPGAISFTSQVANDMLSNVPTIVIANSLSHSGNTFPENLLILDMPAVNPQFRSSVAQKTGADLRSGHAGFCDMPKFFDSEHIGPAWTCIERPASIAQNQNWLGVIGATANALAKGHPNFGSTTVETPFGSVEQPWERDQFIVPGATILNVDHWTIRDNINHLHIPNNDLFGFLCPECSGTGFICGDTCPNSCNNICLKRKDKLCCSADAETSDFQ